jgi:hypothetical protein
MATLERGFPPARERLEARPRESGGIWVRAWLQTLSDLYRHCESSGRSDAEAISVASGADVLVASTCILSDKCGHFAENMPYYVYILSNVTGSVLYTGVTNNSCDE